MVRDAPVARRNRSGQVHGRHGTPGGVVAWCDASVLAVAAFGIARTQQYVERAAAAVGIARGSEGQHARVLAQPLAYARLQYRPVPGRTQPLAMDHAHAGQARTARVGKKCRERTARFGQRAAVQVEFVDERKLPAPQLAHDATLDAIALVVTRVVVVVAGVVQVRTVGPRLRCCGRVIVARAPPRRRARCGRLDALVVESAHAADEFGEAAVRVLAHRPCPAQTPARSR